MAVARARATEVAAVSWRAIGTSVRLAVTDPASLPKARELLADRIAALDLACSRFRPDSELIMAERTPGRPVPVSEVLTDAMAVALDAAHATDGDLDPTVGLALADLGYDRDFTLVPAQGPPLAVTVRPRPRWQEIELDRQARRLTVPQGVRVDLGATAKARAADLAAADLAARLGCGVLVSLGGDLAARGPAPSGGWRVRVQDVTGSPDDEPAGPSQVVVLTGGGLATSGIAARHWRRGDRSLHHILDPRTGQPAEPVWRTVSVLARAALEANIASTTAIIRGARAAGWLERRGAAARLVAADGSIHVTTGWPRQESRAA